MVIGRLSAWEAVAEEPLQAALRRLFPYKAPYSIQRAATRILADTSRAWACFEVGGHAALFDILTLVTDAELPMPPELSWELAEAAALALAGQGVSLGRGKRPPLEEHRASLLKRFRFAHIVDVIADAELDAHEDEPRDGVFARSGLSPEMVRQIRSERTSASSRIMKAIEIALSRMPNVAGAKRAGTPEAYYQDFVEVAAAADAVDWPGRFYLPSSVTCEFLEWGDLQHGFLELGVASDAPRLRVS
jgi:hypothetical protein